MAGIRALGLALGERVVSFAEMARLQGTTEAVVEAVVGGATIHASDTTRSITDTVVALAVKAARECLQRGGVAPGEIDALLWCSGADSCHQSAALRVQHELGASGAFAQVVGASCADLVAALALACHLLRHGGAVRKVLVVSGEAWEDPRTTIPIAQQAMPVSSDGACALLLERDAPHELLGFGFATSGEHWDYLRNLVRSAAGQPVPGKEPLTPLQYVHASVGLHRQALQRCLADAGVSMEDLRHLITMREKSAQARSFARHLGMSPDSLVRIDDGPTHVGVADVAFGLDTLAREGKVRAGDHVLLCGRSFGITQFGVLRWGNP